MEAEDMMQKTGFARNVERAFLLAVVAVFTATVMGDRVWAMDDSPVAGLKEAKIAFDITGGGWARMLRILNPIGEPRAALARQGAPPRFVLAFRGPASLLTQTDLSRLKPEDRETAAKVAAKLKQLRGTAGIE